MSKLSGGLNSWYVVPVKKPQRKEQEPYRAECEDIIQALGMTFDEGCAFKALWRNASARMGNGKPGNTAVYDAQKMVHYTNRILAKEKLVEVVEPMFRHEQAEACSDSCSTSSAEVKDNGWIHSSKEARPSISQTYESIEVVYRNGQRYELACETDVYWDKVWKYRINYS